MNTPAPQSPIQSQRPVISNRPRRQLTRARFVVFAAAALVGSTTLTLLTAETLLSRWAPSTHTTELSESVRLNHIARPRIYQSTISGLRLRRFLDQRHTDPISNRSVLFRTNSLGFRGKPIQMKQPGEMRVLMLGDSITLGAYVEETETIPSQLQNRLCADGRNVTVVNGGVAGLSLREELLLLEETGLFVQPDLVLVGLYLNDAGQAHLLKIPEGLAAQSEIATRFMQAQFNQEVAQDAERAYLQLSGKSMPDKPDDNSAWRVDRDAMEFEIATAAADWGAAWYPQTWELLKPDLDIMRALGKRYGFKVAVALFPVMQQVECNYDAAKPQRLFAQMTNQLAIPSIDLLPLLRGTYQKTRQPLAYDHCHLLPQTNAIVADALADLVTSIIPAPVISSAPALLNATTNGTTP